jgi:hypothetical protein
MSFSVPNFNISVNVWRFGNAPPAAPDLVVSANLAFGRRGSSLQGLYVGAAEPVMTLLLPPSSDVRGPQCAFPDACVEAPGGTGRYYTIIGVDDSGKSWPNEYRVAVIAWTKAFGAWPSPIP